MRKLKERTYGCALRPSTRQASCGGSPRSLSSHSSSHTGLFQKAHGTVVRRFSIGRGEEKAEGCNLYAPPEHAARAV